MKPMFVAAELQRRLAVVVPTAIIVAFVGCSDSRSTSRISDAQALASAADTLLRRVASTQALDATADSLHLVERELQIAADTSDSDDGLQAAVLASRRMQSRQISSLREKSAQNAADIAAARTYLHAVIVALDSVPQRTSTIGSVAQAIVAWPMALILLVALVFAFPRRLSTALSSVRSIRLFNAEVVLSQETTLAAEETFENLRKRAKKRYKQVAHSIGLDQRFIQMMNRDLKPVLESVIPHQDPSLRCTLYVTDILFEKHLAQAVDYWPRGGGQGRAFPIYFGMIGKAWRSGESRINGQIPTEPEQLILEWGMTYEEAVAKGKDRQSFAAIVLRDGRIPIGILYMDCKTPDAFGASDSDRKTLENQIVAVCQQAGVVAAITKFQQELRVDSSPIDLQLEP